ncbi:MAG: RHS repeat-associated core domain-containing protein [Clostridiales bacterium]|nr:RHS repeat-associated core domain-containing protein [Clostridiales bacterium]
MVEWNNGTTTQKFAYVHNLQGDIVAIIDDTGAKVVSYTCDAWGKPLSTTGSLAATLGKLNPFRYRSYVYDEETGLYYLRSRYYNANQCKFINADFIIMGSIFCYCNNSPICYYDTNGMIPSHCKTIFPICIESYSPHRITWHSDTHEKSNELLKELQNSLCFPEDVSAHVSIEYAGIYSKTDSLPGFDMAVSGVGVATMCATYFIPIAGKVKLVIDIISGLATLIGAIRSVEAYNDPLPNKDYYQFQVTISMIDVVNPEEYPFLTNIYHCTYSLTYLYNDTNYTNPSWYLQNHSVDNVTVETMFQ